MRLMRFKRIGETEADDHSDVVEVALAYAGLQSIDELWDALDVASDDQRGKLEKVST